MKNKWQSKGQVKITAQDYQKRFCVVKKPHPGKWGQFRSKWEQDFAQWLTAKGHAWKYEAIRLRLADRTTYTPDFWVPFPYSCFFEVKGLKRQSAMIKYKVAREQYPEFMFKLVIKNQNGSWKIE